MYGFHTSRIFSLTASATRWALACVLFAVGGNAMAQTVNWLDPAVYEKPQAININRPDEATANKYWVDLSSGSGSTCSQASPCGIDNVFGKPGTTGGPAIIYIKGTGGMSWYTDTIYGSGDNDCRTASCANWILIRTWPAGSPGCATECTATITGNSNMNSSNVHHIMWDGGPDLKIRFNSNAGVGTYGQNINSDWHIVYRTQLFCTGSGTLGWQVGSTTSADHVYFINNEFYGCANTGDQTSSVYVGPGAGGGYTDFVFQGNIVRDFFGEGIEINPRITSSNLTITGNAFHNIGKGTCSTAWQCRPAITVSVQSGGGNNNTIITNNLIWDTGSSCIWDRGGGSPKALIANNTCFDYGKGSGAGGPNPEGISGYSDGGSATVRNNIIYAPNGTAPFDGSSFAASNNLCGSGKSCGSASRTWSVSTVLSSILGGLSFMRAGAGSEAVDAGVTVAGVSSSYSGVPRPQGGAYDIGAFEGSAGPRPAAPGGVTVTQ